MTRTMRRSMEQKRHIQHLHHSYMWVCVFIWCCCWQRRWRWWCCHCRSIQHLMLRCSLPLFFILDRTKWLQKIGTSIWFAACLPASQRCLYRTHIDFSTVVSKQINLSIFVGTDGLICCCLHHNVIKSNAKIFISTILSKWFIVSLAFIWTE